MEVFLRKDFLPIKNPNIACSASQVKYFGKNRNYWVERSTRGSFKKLIKKIVGRFQNLQNHPASGTFESKFRYYLKLRGHHHIFYGMYRTEQLKKIFVTDVFNIDFATILNALRFGDFHVVDEILMYRYDGGVSTQGFFAYKKSQYCV